MPDFVIDDATEIQQFSPRNKGKGYDPSQVVHKMFAPPTQIQLIPRIEWSERVRDKVATKSQLSDIRNKGNNGQFIPSLDQGQVGYCLPPGSKVRLSNGAVKNIEDVKLLETVLTAEGNVHRVTQCHVREYCGDMVIVKTWGHSHLRLTPNHEVLTKRGYIPSGNLTTEDFIAIPKYLPKLCGVILSSSHVRARAYTYSNGVPSTHTTVPEVITLTVGIGRIIGLFLAEGHIDYSKNEVCWSFNSKETDTLATELVNLIDTELGIVAGMRDGPATDTVVQVYINGKQWCQLFESLCGKLATGKKLHSDLASGPENFLESVFWGWMDGDGCMKVFDKRSAICEGATVSHSLALSMYDIANSIHLNPAILKEKPQVNKYAKVRQPVWKIKVILEPSEYRPNYRMTYDDKYMWRKVREIIKDTYTGMVYNLGVEGDNSYVAEGVGVHNCWAHSVTHTVILSRARDNQPYIPLSAYAVAATIKHGRDEGGWCGLSAQFIRDKGIPSQDLWPQGDMNYQQYINRPEVWANSALHTILEDWVDLTRDVYDQNLTFDQVATCLLLNIPCALDYNWWGHSVCGMDLVETQPGQFGLRILNSWSDNWGENGTGVLVGQRAIPDGAIATRAVTASDE